SGVSSTFLRTILAPHGSHFELNKRAHKAFRKASRATVQATSATSVPEWEVGESYPSRRLRSPRIFRTRSRSLSLEFHRCSTGTTNCLRHELRRTKAHVAYPDHSSSNT